jgi:hypothetical protein
MLNHHPFKSSRFDPYHGDQGTAPFQEVIEYTNSRGGLVFWAHPESNYSKDGVRMGPIKLITGHYADELIASINYTGFAALYGDTSNTADAGSYWDRILKEYCEGRRDRPVWAIAESDFHQEQKGFELDSFQTIFLVRNREHHNVLQALRSGRVYAVRKFDGSRLSLDEFHIIDKNSDNRATMGEEISVNGSPIVAGKLSLLDGSRQDVTVSIIRDGKKNWTFKGQTPLDFHLIDQDNWSGKTYYRLDARGRTAGRLLSNPIFVIRNH